jgi:GTP diphosphokinase / guanosine-3',5'-bis(diphosphate) 3'-diphosphatase
MQHTNPPREPLPMFALAQSQRLPPFRSVLRQYELVEKVRSYDPDADEGLINRAYVFSMKAHGSQVRASGDPYFSHPIEVAGILTDLKLDDQTIATAILHDTIEDTLATPEEIEKLFGKNVARLVDGVTKLSKIEAQSENERAAENLRKFLLALSDDIRVLLVKLADRLHNMRTLHHVPSEEKRRRIARETMDIYAPLAERIGMYEMMTEMQTLAFRELEPDAYASITRRLEQLHKEGGDLVNRIGLGLQLHLADNGLEAEVTGREKHPYSIWRKMAERHISFEQLSDVMAFRVIVEDVDDCYRALWADPPALADGPGPLQGLHLDAEAQRLPVAPHVGHPRFENADRNPDPHTRDARAGRARPCRSLGLQGRQAQGRSQDSMGRRAGRDPRARRKSRGAARAHPNGDVPGPDLRLHPKGRADPAAQRARLRSISLMRCTPISATAPSAPRSTAGWCRLRTMLENGDQVEILASEAQHPQPSWLRFVATGKARAGVRRFVRHKERDETIELGRKIYDEIVERLPAELGATRSSARSRSSRWRTRTR